MKSAMVPALVIVLFIVLAHSVIPVRGDLTPSGGITPVTQSGAWVTQLPASSAVVINSAATTPVKATAGTLRRITITLLQSNQTIKLFDLAAAACTGTPTLNPRGVILVPSASGNPFTLEFQQAFANGICVLTSGVMNLTVIYD